MKSQTTLKYYYSSCYLIRFHFLSSSISPLQEANPIIFLSVLFCFQSLGHNLRKNHGSKLGKKILMASNQKSCCVPTSGSFVSVRSIAATPCHIMVCITVLMSPPHNMVSADSKILFIPLRLFSTFLLVEIVLVYVGRMSGHVEL